MSIDRGKDFTNPNYKPGKFSFSDEQNIPEGKTGIVVVDAANKSWDEREKLKQRAEEAEKNSYVDVATGCQNRNSWENFVKNEFNPGRDKISLIVCDINNLKKTNDEQGHSAGDLLILKTALFLKNSYRKGDVVYRYGGDEFIIVCHGVLDENFFLKEVNKRFAPDTLKDNGLSFAFGVAHFDKNIDTDGLAFISDKDKNKKTTMNRADQLMYQKKLNKKNKIR